MHAGPLFIHQMSHLWIDFRGIRDSYMRERGLDYFENSPPRHARAAGVRVDNPRGFEGYAGIAGG